MKIEILGCSGGMGNGEHTTCIRIDEHLLIDAGSGLGALSQDEMLAIKQVFLTHAHLDHICFLPLLLDNLFEQLKSPVEVLALPETLKVLREHIFNWQVWPDFSVLPDSQQPVLRYRPISMGQTMQTAGLTLTPLLAIHAVPTCGYRVVSAEGKVFCFSGDTRYDDSILQAYNLSGPIDMLMLECAFPDRLKTVAEQSKHFTPQGLMQFLQQLEYPPESVLITHLKPAFRKEICAELTGLKLPSKLHFISSGDTFFL
ncbi:3',5'-cyclic-nucleotide phosphodiesterase [Nitrincola sp.]|uniref:3',5'-cyclic-nucleotide phosphodiesterase n=1 Tax=Nitrincola sp. TaxID=1926584 RepID=UPI003A93D876